MQIKFNYSDGGEFTLPNGSDFVGYFNIDDSGNAYTERYYSNASVLLGSISEYSADYHKSNYFKNRFVFDILELPYTLDQILIQPNEIVNFNVLNKKVEYLHENLLYMYSKMFMGSTDVPNDDDIDTLCCINDKTSFDWETKSKNAVYKFYPLSANPQFDTYSEFDNLKKFVVIPFIDKSGVSILGISNTHLIGLTSSMTDDGRLSNSRIILYTDVIDNDSQEKCKNLEDITFDGKYLYISDSKINEGGQIFKYDVLTYYTNDDIFDGKRFLIEPIGGIGGSDRKNKFYGCSVLGTKQNELWVYDSGNNVIKIYDYNFVWKRTIKVLDIGYYKILDIRHRVLNDHMYVLYEKTDTINNAVVKIYGMFEYDEKYKLVYNHIFEDIFYNSIDRKFNRMAISEQDSDVFYIITDSNIYKKFFTKPEKSFANFDRSKYYPNDTFELNIKDVFVLSNKNNKDDLFFMGTSYISHLNEKTDYLTVLREIKLPYYNYERIKFEGIEFNQGIVLNKEFYKLFSNIIQFKNSLKGRFYAEYNEYSDLMYRDYIYLSDDEINTLNIELEYNTFINDNELVQPNVINRLFRKIYSFQLSLLSLTNVRLKNLKTWVDAKGGSNIYPIL